MATTTGQPLESLFVTIEVDQAPFLKAAGDVERGIDALEAKFVNFGKNVSAAFSGGMEGVSRSLSQIGRFIESVEALSSLDKIKNVAAPLKQFTDDFKAAAVGFTSVDTAGMALALSRVGGFMRSATNFTFDPKQISSLSGTLQTLFGSLAGTAGNVNFDVASKTIGRFSALMNSLMKFDVSTFTKVGEPLKNFIGSFAGMDTGAADNTAKSMGRIASTVARLGKVDAQNLIAAATSAKQAVAILNSTVVNPNVMASLNALSRLASIARRAGAGGAIPPGINVTATFGSGPSPAATGMSQVASSAKRAQSNVSDLGREFRSFSSASDRLVGALTSVHMAMVTVATFSLRQFAQQDDALTRAYANMVSREGTPGFEQSTKSDVQAKLMDLSGRTRTGMVDLAKGFDLLASSGMSAGMAVDAVATAETFALAGGMKMEDATRRLVDIQRIMGLNSENTATHLQRMANISDVLAGTAPRVGSTVQELASAFTGKLAVAANQANMSLNDTVAVLGVMSQQGFRGGAGGDLTSRLLTSLGRSRSGMEFKWVSLLGEDIYDTTGKMMDMAVVSDRLTATLGSMGDKQRMAKLTYLGFDTKSMPGILAMIGQGDNIRKMREDMAGMKDVADKMAEVMRRSFMGQMTTMYNSAMNLASVIGERLAPMIFALTEPIRLAVSWFTKLNPALQQLAVIGAVAAVGLGPLAAGLRYVIGLPFRVIGSLVGAVTSVASAAVSGLQTIYDTGSAVVSVFTAAGSVMLQAFMLPLRGVYLLTSAVWHIGEAALAVGKTTADVLSKIVSGLVIGFVNIAAGLLTILTSIVAAFIAIPLIVGLLTTVGAALAAVVVTLGVGLAQLGVMLGSGIVALWAGFKAAVAGAFAWMSGRMIAMHEGVKGVWESFKDGAADAFVAIGRGLEKIAGFLWNFRENIKLIADWWAINWKAAIVDIGNLTTTILENLGTNALRVFGAVVGTLSTAFSPIGSMIVRLFADVFEWTVTNWDRMLKDAFSIFTTFVSNVSKNFMLILPVIDAIVAYMANGVLSAMTLSAAGAKQTMDISRARIQYEIAHLAGDKATMKAVEWTAGRQTPGMFGGISKKSDETAERFRGPLEGLPKMQTRWGDLGGRFGDTFGQFGEQFGGMGNKIKGLWGTAMGGMSPLLDGLKTSAPWEELFKSLNLKLPPDAMSTLLSSMVGPIRPANEPGEGGAMMAKGGPGWAFKQSSMARTEVGGEFQQSLEFQQLSVLQAIRKDIGIIADAMSSRGPVTTLKMPRPMKEGD